MGIRRSASCLTYGTLTGAFGLTAMLSVRLDFRQ